MAAVVQEAARLGVTAPELAASCVSTWGRWGRHLAKPDLNRLDLNQ
jgi:hypothetical protein